MASVAGLCDWAASPCLPQLSLLGGALPMFELVEQQPSHLACPDVLNLSLGECRACRPQPGSPPRLFCGYAWSVPTLLPPDRGHCAGGTAQVLQTGATEGQRQLGTAGGPQLAAGCSFSLCPAWAQAAAPFLAIPPPSCPAHRSRRHPQPAQTLQFIRGWHLQSCALPPLPTGSRAALPSLEA